MFLCLTDKSMLICKQPLDYDRETITNKNINLFLTAKIHGNLIIQNLNHNKIYLLKFLKQYIFILITMTFSNDLIFL